MSVKITTAAVQKNVLTLPNRTIARVGQTKGSLMMENLVAVAVCSSKVKEVSRLPVGHTITHKKYSPVNGRFLHPTNLFILNSQSTEFIMGSMVDLLAGEIT